MRENISRNRPRRPLGQRSCFLVSFQYKEGLARGDWTTQAGASRALGVSQAELSMALRLDSLPADLLRIFAKDTDVTSHTVRVISDVIAHDGLETVRDRIRPHAAAGSRLPAKVVLALMRGRLSGATKALPLPGRAENELITRLQDLPAYVSNRYRLGTINGEWTSYSDCSRASGISRRNISHAVSIGQLPDSVKSLFKETDLTFAVGRKLLAIERNLGTNRLQARASDIRSMAHEHTAEYVLRELNGDNVRPENFSRIRIKKGRGAKRLIIECDDAVLLLRYRREMEAALNKTVRKLTVSQKEQTERALHFPRAQAAC